MKYNKKLQAEENRRRKKLIDEGHTDIFLQKIPVVYRDLKKVPFSKEKEMKQHVYDPIDKPV